jgi:hypothetical protein
MQTKKTTSGHVEITDLIVKTYKNIDAMMKRP